MEPEAKNPIPNSIPPANTFAATDATGRLTVPKTLPTDDPSKEIHNIRTYSSDMAEAVREGKGSVVKIAMAEEEKRQREVANVSAKTPKNMLYIGGGITLLVVAIIVIILIATHKSTPTTVTPDVVTATTLVSSDQNRSVDVTNFSRNQVIKAIGSEVAAGAPSLGKILNLSLVETGTAGKVAISTDRFLTLMNMDTPATLRRSLDPTFMAGVYSFNGTDLFFIFKTNSHDVGFAGMLAWETKLFDDFYEVFNIPASGADSNLFGKKFTDMVIKNHDARALLDANNKPVFFYTFLDETTIMIATSPDATTEALRRLSRNTIRG